MDQLIGSLAKEDMSRMDLAGMLRVLFRLNPKLLWGLKSLII
jgi:digeranylgeranylglycerophospholipid reductase